MAREHITDPRLDGTAYFHYTVAVNVGTFSGAFWGTSRIVPDIGGGEWTGYWVASMTPAGTTIKMTVAGTGDYEGLVARLTYTSGPEKLQIAGYIVEAKGGPGDRPFKVNACRKETIAFLPCMVLDPETWGPANDPPEFKMIIRADIVSEAGQATHAGRIGNEGLAVVDLETGHITGKGTATAANGEELFWVYFGAYDASGAARGSVHFCGGSGRFDVAVGGFDVATQPVFEPAEDEGVFSADYCYSGGGTIRY